MSEFSPNRRDALRLGAAAILAGGATQLASAKDEAPYGEFTVAIQSYTFRNFKFDAAMKKIQDLKINNVELFRGHVPTDSTDDQIKAAKKLLADHEISPVAFGVEGFSNNHDENKKRFEFAAKLGVKHLSADPSEDSFDSLDKLVKEYKISIAIHPHGPMGKGLHKWYSAEVIMKAVKDHDPLIGTCLDTGHLIRSEQLGEKLDPAKQIEVMGARNFGMHLKDHDNKRKTDVVYGKDGGVLDVASVVKALRKVKFKGYIAVEYEANPNDPSKDVAACLEILKDTIKKG